MSGGDRAAGAVVVDTSASPHAKLRPVPVGAVRLSDAFWEPRRRTNREATIPSQHRQCEDTGCIDNFRRAAGKDVPVFKGMRFGDTDAYKWLEAASWSLAADPDPELERTVDGVIAEIGAAQQENGYLNTRFMFEEADKRWTDLPVAHELYCAGHLFQAAVAHNRATGKDSLLGIAKRFADHICETFGPEGEGKKEGTGGHPEVEVGLVELYRATGEERYLKQAQYFVDARGRGLAGGNVYHQDQKPFRELDRMFGHAVRAGYLNAGVADLVAETGEKELRVALDRMWENMTTTQMYVTGGVGSRHAGEAFGRDYELPNERAYTETCAQIAVVMWAWRMLALEGDARYADVMEHVLLNGVLPGLSLDGKEYFYENPLSDDGTHRRKEWFGCACCPPNVARLLASLPGRFYSVASVAEGNGGDAAVWVHMYAEGKAKLALADGRRVSITQRTRYPWDGEVELEVGGEGEYALMLRVPGWCEEGAAVEVNGERADAKVRPGSYVEIRRAWKTGDKVRLALPMPIRRIECHPHVAENAGRVALARGPVVYCVEAADNPGFDLRDLVLPDDAAIAEERRDDLLGGVTVLKAPALVSGPDGDWGGRLYRSVGPGRREAEARGVEMVAVPYYAWANREPGRMQVWLRSR